MSSTNANRTIKEEVRLLGARKRPLTYGQMADVIRERHPEAQTSIKTVQWYASNLRRSGVEVNVKDGRTGRTPAAASKRTLH